MMSLFREIFTWWDGNTIGTRFHTWRKGKFVGEDELGNRYYQLNNGKRRWVIYKNRADASLIPPGWHGWMHYSIDTPPTDQNYQEKSWQKDHIPNLTGTSRAHRPQGSVLASGKRPSATGDYESWQPDK